MKPVTQPSRNRVFTAGSWWILLGLSLLLAAACGPATPVTEGQVISFEGGTKLAIAVIASGQESPGSERMEIDLTGAEIGADPEEGDIVRIAYTSEGGNNQAIRLMNLTRQKERAESGH